MSNYNSQEQTISRYLAGQIQLGFFDNGERFPSVLDLTQQFGVSYCPAQRALKILERNGLISLSRGKIATVIKKPYENYLDSEVFHRRAGELTDLIKGLDILSPALCYQGIYHIREDLPDSPVDAHRERAYYVKLIYQLFDCSIQSLGNRMVVSLYNDIGAYSGSSMIDILYAVYGEKKANSILYKTTENFLQSVRPCQDEARIWARQTLRRRGQIFFSQFESYLREQQLSSDSLTNEPFCWEPIKGRTKYCDIIALNMIAQINQGVYPLDTLLPTVNTLAETYHVSPITMRRAIAILNDLNVTRTLNGIGTKVIFKGDISVLSRFKDLMLDRNLKDYLEACQFFTMTFEPLVRCTFPYFTDEAIGSIHEAARMPDKTNSAVATVTACLQAVIRCSPLASIREIYGRLIPIFLKGTVMRLDGTAYEKFPGWTHASAIVCQACLDRNGELLTQTLGQLLLDSFPLTRRRIIALGVKGAEDVVIPVKY